MQLADPSNSLYNVAWKQDAKGNGVDSKSVDEFFSQWSIALEHLLVKRSW